MILLTSNKFLLYVGLCQEQKKRILQLERQISAAKKSYSETLQSLEKISDDIHTQRRQERRRAKKVRQLAKASGNDTVIYHPLMDAAGSSSDDDSGNETSGDADSRELAVPPLVGVVAVKHITVRQIDCVPNASVRLPADSSPVPVDIGKPLLIEGATHVNSQQTEASIEKTSVPCDVDSGDVSSGVCRTSSLAESSSSPESDLEHLQANAAVMAAISRSKLQRVACPFLRPDSCREDFSVNGSSETESVSGSFVSGGVGTLDDEQIESLMVDVSEYQRIVADMDAAESDRYQQMALPARLRHLQDFVKFEPVWTDDYDNGEVVGSTQNCDARHTQNCDAECRGPKTQVADGDVFPDSESVEFFNSQSHSNWHQSANVTLDKKECLVTADDVWHPLMDNVSSTTVSESTDGHE